MLVFFGNRRSSIFFAIVRDLIVLNFSVSSFSCLNFESPGDSSCAPEALQFFLRSKRIFAKFGRIVQLLKSGLAKLETGSANTGRGFEIFMKYYFAMFTAVKGSF